jgi:DNA mismatch repair ATPase MutS
MLIDDYIIYVNKYKKIYDKCLILIQVGSFYELYGYGNEGADVEEICRIMGIQSTKKSNSKPNIDKYNPRMGGFPLPVLDKYLDILMEEGYTVVIVDQVTPPPEPKREVTRILSPATRDIENQFENNYLMCLYFTIGSINSNKFYFSKIQLI